MGISKGGELALLLASRALRPSVVPLPSCRLATWYGLNMSDPASVKQPSSTELGMPFLPFPEGGTASFSEDGMRVDDCYDLTNYPSEQVDAARITVERACGPILAASLPRMPGMAEDAGAALSASLLG